MGSPEAGIREKDLVKRRKGEPTHYSKDREWEDDEAYEEDRRHRSSKSRKSSKTDRDGSAGGGRRERDKDKDRDRDDRDRDRDRGDRVSRGREEYYEKAEKRLRASTDDKYEEKVEREDLEFLSSRAGSGKRRNGLDKASRKPDAILVEEDEEGRGEAQNYDVIEERIRKHELRAERAYDVDEAKARKNEARAARTLDDEKVRKSEPRGERVQVADEKVKKKEFQTTRRHDFNDEMIKKKNYRSDRPPEYEEERSRHKDIRAERLYSHEEVRLPSIDPRGERPYDVEEKVRRSDAHPEKVFAVDGEKVSKTESRTERASDLDTDKIRKMESRADRGYDVEEQKLKTDWRVERAENTSKGSGFGTGYSKSRRHYEDEKDGRDSGRVYVHDGDEEKLRKADLRSERAEKFDRDPVRDDHPRSRSGTERSREIGDLGKDANYRYKEFGDRSKVLEDVYMDRTGVYGEFEEFSNADWKRSGREKVRASKGEREERDRESEKEARVQIDDEGRAEVKLEHSEELRSGTSSRVGAENRDEKSAKRSDRSKEKSSTRWDKPDPMVEEVLDSMKEKKSRSEKVLERFDSRWDESAEGKPSSRTRREKPVMEERHESKSRGREKVVVVLGEDSEDGFKSGRAEKVEESIVEPHHHGIEITEQDESEEIVKIAASAGADQDDRERGDDSKPEKSERHRREKERLERVESDDWGKNLKSRERGERQRGQESSRFDYSYSREKVEWEDIDDTSKYAGEKEERGEGVPRLERRRGKERLEREDSDFGGRFSGRAERVRERRDETGREDYQRKGRERRDERYDEYEGGGRANTKGKAVRGDYEREKHKSREKPEAGREEVDDFLGRTGGRDRGEEERAGRSGAREVVSEAGRGVSVAKEKGEEEKLGRSRLEEEKGRKLAAQEHVVEDSGARLGSNRDEDAMDKVRSRGRERTESGHEISEDGGRSKSRARSGKAVTVSQSPDDPKGGRSDLEDWSDDREDYERERGSSRRGGQKRDRDSRERERERYRGRERPHDRSWDRERERGRDWEEALDRERDRHRDRRKDLRDVEKGREIDYQVEQDNWESKKRREKVDRERVERERMEREGSERSRMDRERVEGLRSPRGFGSMSESSGRGNHMPSHFMESGRGASSHGGPYMPPGGEPGFFPGEYFGGVGEVEWDGPLMDDRMRIIEGIFLGGGERYMEEEGPLGHDPAFGPSRGGSGDNGMGYTVHPGRGRGSKGSPGNRGRGGMIGPDGRPHFGNNQGGPMLRGMQQQHQQGGKGRGPRGGPKGIRGPGREGQRGTVNPPLMGPGPGLGPHFGPLGPQGPMPGMGMGPGPGPGPMGQFSMPPFGGPMGWGGGRGGGEMGMMGCPPGPGPGIGPGPGGLGPRFGPGMGPGPGPNMFFNPPGPGRGGPSGLPGGMFGAGAPPFLSGGGGGGRGQMGERGPPGSGRGAMGRGNGPPGRGPSRGEQNDYSQHFVDTGLRPQNFIRDVELADRFEEYPKLKELISRKDRLIADRATPPMYMQCDLRTMELRPETFGTKFDVILVDPPWEEYVRRAPGIGDSMEWWSAEDIQNLRIEAIADTPAFIFLWVGDAEGLEQGRLCLKKWGFRRCEDICWVKTNRENPTPALRHDSNTLFQHSKEHCLMGIKGTVRRSTDGHIIHANVDTDIIISEEPEYGSTTKPEELYHIIEHFAQGQRRIELFGEDHNIRAGWVTVGKGLTSSNFNPQTYPKCFADSDGKVWQGGRGNPPVDAHHLVGTTPEIEALRPKSPPPRPQQPQPSGQGNAGNSLSQPSGGNSISKKTSTGQGGGGQNGHSPAPIPGAGHGSANPLGAGPNAIGQPPQVGGRGGGHGQIPKLRQPVPGILTKPLGAGPGIEELGVDEELSYGGDIQETTTAEEVLAM